MKPDSPKETACLDRARIWEGLIGWCEELEGDEIEAEVGQPDHDPAVMMSSFSNPGGAPSLKRPKTKRTAGGDARPYNGKRQTENRKRLLKGMTKAVARDLGLI
jgi:hypothetical protein